MRRTNLGSEGAQGLIEFAILVPVLLLFFLGTIDFSRYMYFDTAVTSAARTGAEMATNEVLSGPFASGAPTTYMTHYILQATACEGSPTVSLAPAVSCSACQTVSTTCTGTNVDPCASAWYNGSPPACNACSQDICVARYPSGGSCSPAPQSWTTAPNNGLVHGQCVRVVVGYNFQPVTFLISKFLPTRACWVGDTTTHTICASAAGRRV